MYCEALSSKPSDINYLFLQQARGMDSKLLKVLFVSEANVMKIRLDWRGNLGEYESTKVTNQC